MSRKLRVLLASIMLVLLAGVVLGSPAVAVAATKGTGGWYWPVGTENFHGWDGYWKFRPGNHCWHLAQDMPVPQGSPVYAIADGTVAEWKPASGYGGVVVIWHKTGAGQKFFAIYGHMIHNARIVKGAKVKAGEVIGHVNSYNHLHFGIHPGDKYPHDNNPYRGHTYTSSDTYGFVDPVKFLQDNPAYLPYTAPALPLVMTVSTQSTPTVLGVAQGNVYWSVVSGDDSATVFALPLTGSGSVQLSEDATLPVLDKKRFLVTTGSTWLKLWDRFPVLAASYSTTKPAWKQALSVSGSLKSAGGKPFSGAKISLLLSYDRKKWTSAGAGVSGPKGSFSIAYVPARRCSLRVKFAPPSTFVATAGVSVAVAPQPGLHAPDTIKEPKTGRMVTLSGLLDARHTAGAHSVSLRLQCLDSGAWVDELATWAANADAAKGATRYSRTIKLGPGSWRVCSSCKSDKLYAAESTSWVAFTVK